MTGNKSEITKNKRDRRKFQVYRITPHLQPVIRYPEINLRNNTSPGYLAISTLLSFTNIFFTFCLSLPSTSCSRNVSILSQAMPSP